MKCSLSIHPCLTTWWRMLAFCPPPNAVDEMAAKVTAMSTREGSVCAVRAGVAVAASQLTSGSGPSTSGRGVLTRENMNVHVLGVLVRRQHAHANHEASFVQAELERDLLNTGDQPAPNRAHRRDPKSRIVGTHSFGMMTTCTSHHSALL